MANYFLSFLPFLLVVGVEHDSKPPESAGKSPEAILQCFCLAWSNGEYEKMYNCLTAQQQDKLTFEEWEKRLKEETKIRGLIVSFEFEGPERGVGSRSLWRVKITYKNNRVGTQLKKNWIAKEEEGWRVDEGGLIPRPTRK